MSYLEWTISAEDLFSDVCRTRQASLHGTEGSETLQVKGVVLERDHPAWLRRVLIETRTFDPKPKQYHRQAIGQYNTLCKVNLLPIGYTNS